MASMEEALLEAGGHRSTATAPRPWARALARTAAAAGCACGAALLATGLFLGGAEYGRTTPHTGQVHGVAFQAMNITQAGAATSLGVRLDLGCYSYTGGTCFVDPCAKGRMADCSVGLCVCGEGKCSDVNGVCRDAKNKFVASGFTLVNAKFGDQAMYMTATDPFKHVKTTAAPSFLNGNTDKWTLYELPGSMHIEGVLRKGYLLSTLAFPDYVAAAQATLGTALSPFGAFEVGLYKEKSPASISVRVCSRKDGTIMIGAQGVTSATTTQWFYLHHGSWEVFTWGLGDPGVGGHWRAEPPLPEGAVEDCGDL